MKADIAIRLPDHISFEEGAAISSGISTVALSMYSPKTLDFPIPTLPITKEDVTKKFIFIYGGSSASGSLAIQFAKLYVAIYPTTL
jgi:NADPH:quinone reductase-like Zn-dependent oxidoreductase